MYDLSKLDTQTLNKYLEKTLMHPNSAEYDTVSLVKHTASYSNLLDENGNIINFEDTVENVYKLSEEITCSVLFADSMFTYIVTNKGQLLATTYALLKQGKVFQGWIESMYPIKKICAYYGNDDSMFRSRMRSAVKEGKELNGDLVKEAIELASPSFVKKTHSEIKSFKLAVKGTKVRDSLYKYECKDGRRNLSTYKDMESFLYSGYSALETNGE